MNKSETPETDAALLRYTGGELVTFPKGINTVVNSDFARRLELRNRRLVEALRFYADARRHEGANQEPIKDDIYGPKDFPYMWSIGRDAGHIARAALNYQQEEKTA